VGEKAIQEVEPSLPPVGTPPRMRFFSFDGRIGRKQYVSAMVGAVLVAYALSGLLLVGTGVLPMWLVGILAIVVLAVDVLLLWCILALDVKRLHDLGRSGWWLLVGFIPLVGLFMVPYLWLVRGTGKRNDQGL